ncbi:MAG: hypothetical protein AB1627_03410 [Chloroflexota bacterium]
MPEGWTSLDWQPPSRLPHKAGIAALAEIDGRLVAAGYVGRSDGTSAATAWVSGKAGRIR